MKKLFNLLIICLSFMMIFVLYSCNQDNNDSSDKQTANLERIAVTKLPKTEYELYQSLDVSGGQITAYYSDNTNKVVDLTSSMISGFDSMEEGDVDLTVSYTSGKITKTTTYTISIISSASIERISVEASKTTYYEGDQLDKSTLKVTAHLSNGKTKEVTDYSVNKDVLAYGDTKVLITYQGKACELSINVLQLEVVSLQISTKPTKLNYYVGDLFDPSGMVVNATFNNGNKKVITNYVYNTNPLTINDSMFTISYGGQRTNLALTISPVEISDFRVISNPTKTTYQTGEVFNPAGMKLAVVYNNGKQEEVTDYQYDDNPLTYGQTSVKVSYLSYQTNVAISVLAFEKTVTKVEISSNPTKLDYFMGQYLDLSGGKLLITFSDTSTLELDLTENLIDKEVIDSLDQDLKITYNYQDKEYKFTIDLNIHNDYSVSDAYKNVSDNLVSVYGVYIGNAGSGQSVQEGIILQDVNTNEIMVVHGALALNLPYQKGDMVRLIGKVEQISNANYSENGFVFFTVNNNSYTKVVEDEIISKHNCDYNLDAIERISITNQDDLVSALSTNRGDNFLKLLVINGPIYFVQYASSTTTEENSYFRLYLDSTFDELAKQKIDGLSPVIRNSYSSNNIGASFSHSILGLTDADYKTSSFSKPIVFEGSLTLLYVGGNNYYHQLVLLDDNMITSKIREEITPSMYGDVMKAIAYSYYYQGTQIQYDQLNSRRHLNPNPERASSEEILYLDCSSFANAVFRYAFGRNILPDSYTAATTANFEAYSSTNTSSKDDVIYYYVTSDYTTDAKKTEVLNKVRSALQPGDYINYRHGKSSGNKGHIMLYIGDDMFLHCTGTSYVDSSDGPEFSYDSATSVESSKGGIQLLNASEVFTNTSSSRYLFRKTSDDTIYSFSLMRPLNLSGLSLTTKAKEKYYASGLDFERSVDVKEYTAVNAGDTLTYKVTLVNHSSSAVYDLKVTENYSSSTTVIDNSITNGGYVSGSSVKWFIGKMNPNQTLQLTYQVTVNPGATGFIETSGNVNSMPANPIINTISKLSKSDISNLSSTGLSLVGSTSYTDSFAFVNDVYLQVTGSKFTTDYSNVAPMLSDLVNTSTGLAKSGTKASKMLIKNLFGGRNLDKGSLSSNAKIRRLMESYLTPGDIILVYNSYDYTYTAYLYVTTKTFVTCKDNKIVKVDNAINNVNFAFTTKLCAYAQYAVIRPSLV